MAISFQLVPPVRAGSPILAGDLIALAGGINERIDIGSAVQQRREIPCHTVGSKVIWIVGSGSADLRRHRKRLGAAPRLAHQRQ